MPWRFFSIFFLVFVGLLRLAYLVDDTSSSLPLADSPLPYPLCLITLSYSRNENKREEIDNHLVFTSPSDYNQSHHHNSRSISPSHSHYCCLLTKGAWLSVSEWSILESENCRAHSESSENENNNTADNRKRKFDIYPKYRQYVTAIDGLISISTKNSNKDILGLSSLSPSLTRFSVLSNLTILLFGDSVDQYTVRSTCLRFSSHAVYRTFTYPDVTRQFSKKDHPTRVWGIASCHVQVPHPHRDVDADAADYINDTDAVANSNYNHRINLIDFAMIAVFHFGAVRTSVAPWLSFEHSHNRFYMDYVANQVARIPGRSIDQIKYVVVQQMLWDARSFPDMSVDEWSKSVFAGYVPMIHRYLTEPILKHDCYDLPLSDTLPLNISDQCLTFLWLNQSTTDMRRRRHLPRPPYEIFHAWRSFKSIADISANISAFQLDLDSLSPSSSSSSSSFSTTTSTTATRSSEVDEKASDPLFYPSHGVGLSFAWRTAPLSPIFNRKLLMRRNQAARIVSFNQLQDRGARVSASSRNRNSNKNRNITFNDANGTVTEFKLDFVEYSFITAEQETCLSTDGIHFRDAVNLAFTNMLINYVEAKQQEQEQKEHVNCNLHT